MPLGYRAGLDLTKLEENYRKLRKLALTNHILMPSGSGSMAPLPEIINLVNQWNTINRSRMKIATPSEFFEALEKKTADLPVRSGEMYSSKYSYIFPDCCSSRIWIKKNLRKYENWLLSFERFLTALKILNPAYHTSQYISELKDMWDKVLFLGFHDVVPGTGMDSAYDDVKEYIGFLRTKLSYLHPKILTTLVDEDSNEDDYGDIAVFNPLSWDVSNWVEVDLNFNEGAIGKIGGLICGEEEIDVEVIRFTRYEDESLRYARIGFIANVPAMGYKIYKITRGRRRIRGENFIKVKGNKIITSKLMLSFEPESGLVDIFLDDKKICRANELVMEEESGDLYYHKESIGIPIKTEGGEGFEFGSFRMKNFRIEKSPLRRVIKIDTDYYCLRWPYRLTKVLKAKVWRHNYLRVSKKIIVYRDLPRIDFVTTVRNNHPRLRLRVRFSTDIKVPQYYCDSQFGAVGRPTNYYYFNPEGWMDKPAGVFPSLRWIDYSDGSRGLTIINTGNPENEVRDGNVYITLLRGVGVLSSDGKAGPIIPVPDARETKTYTFRYSLYPHKGDWKAAKSYKTGYEFNYNLVALQLPANRKFRRKRSFVRIEPDNVIMTALKPSESSDGFILRFYEASGVETEATISLFKEPSSVLKTNLMEEEEERLDTDGNVIKVTLKPFEIVTLKMIF
jgi:alpha-mannosidase